MILINKIENLFKTIFNNILFNIIVLVFPVAIIYSGFVLNSWFQYIVYIFIYILLILIYDKAWYLLDKRKINVFLRTLFGFLFFVLSIYLSATFLVDKREALGIPDPMLLVIVLLGLTYLPSLISYFLKQKNNFSFRFYLYIVLTSIFVSTLFYQPNIVLEIPVEPMDYSGIYYFVLIVIAIDVPFNALKQVLKKKQNTKNQ